MPSPLITTQQAINAALSASNNKIVVGSDDATTFRVSALGVNIADISNADASDFRVSAFSDAAGQLRVSAIQDGAAALNVSAKSNDASAFRVSAFQIDGASIRISAIPATQSGAGYYNLTAASSVNVLTGKGILQSVILNTSSTARIVLFDSTSHGANTIGTIDGVATKLTQLNYNAPVSAGITISAVSAPGDVTITWIAL